MHDYLKMVDVTDAIKIMDTHRNDNNSDVDDLDFIDVDENIEISLEEEIFGEKSDQFVQPQSRLLIKSLEPV